MDQPAYIQYRKSRFQTRLPTERRYTAAHFWLLAVDERTWRIGFTKFATRMLGDLVEAEFEVAGGDSVAVGQVIGFVEGLKAASDLFCVANGNFLRGNPDLAAKPEAMQKDPYGSGWLYEVAGSPEPDAIDAAGYAALLDAQIERMQGEMGYDQ